MCEQLQLKQDEIDAKEEVEEGKTDALITAARSASGAAPAPSKLSSIVDRHLSYEGGQGEVSGGGGVPWERFAALLQSQEGEEEEEKERVESSSVVEDAHTNDASFDAEALVARGAILGHRNDDNEQQLSGWQGAAVQWTTRQPLTFLPASPQHATVFSDSAHRDEVRARRSFLRACFLCCSIVNSLSLDCAFLFLVFHPRSGRRLW